MRVLVPVHRTISAAQLARATALDGELVLLRVLQRADPALEAAARAYLDTLVAHLAARGIAALAQVAVGPLAATVLAYARAHQVDTIVLGISRRPRMLRGVLSGPSGAIARGAPCPVVLVERGRSDLPRGSLLNFAEAAERAGLLSRRLPRSETVEVARIVGSVGRASELGADFRPPRRARRKHDEQRLERIKKALEQGKILPPIELYQLGYGFYVVDGHHRVAAALLLDQPEIDAYVVDHVPTGHLARAKTDRTRSLESSQAQGDSAAA